MAITLTTKSTASYTATITVAAGKILKVTNDGVEDTQFQLTAPAGQALTVKISVQATS